MTTRPPYHTPPPPAAARAAPYAPPDQKLAYHAWVANCGPAALAAVTRRRVLSVRRLFPHFPARPWANPTHVRAALDAARVGHRARTGWPGYGMAFLQLEGPWEAPGVPVAAAYRHTHWVGSAFGQVYDVNADGWLSRAQWEAAIVTRLLAHAYRATGWRVRTALEVRPPATGGEAVPG